MNQQTLVPYKAITKLFILKPARLHTPDRHFLRISGLIHSGEAFIFLLFFLSQDRNQPQSHRNHPDIGAGLRHHKRSDCRNPF